jgi:hypothetical protein
VAWIGVENISLSDSFILSIFFNPYLHSLVYNYSYLRFGVTAFGSFLLSLVFWFWLGLVGSGAIYFLSFLYVLLSWT